MTTPFANVDFSRSIKGNINTIYDAIEKNHELSGWGRPFILMTKDKKLWNSIFNKKKLAPADIIFLIESTTKPYVFTSKKILFPDFDSIFLIGQGNIELKSEGALVLVSISMEFEKKSKLSKIQEKKIGMVSNVVSLLKKHVLSLLTSIDLVKISPLAGLGSGILLVTFYPDLVVDAERIIKELAAYIPEIDPWE